MAVLSAAPIIPNALTPSNLNEDAAASAEPETVEGRVCPKCESPLVFKAGKYGKFIGCSGYPKCKHIEPLEKTPGHACRLSPVQKRQHPQA